MENTLVRFRWGLVRSTTWLARSVRLARRALGQLLGDLAPPSRAQAFSIVSCDLAIESREFEVTTMDWKGAASIDQPGAEGRRVDPRPHLGKVRNWSSSLLGRVRRELLRSLKYLGRSCSCSPLPLARGWIEFRSARRSVAACTEQRASRQPVAATEEEHLTENRA